MTFAELHSCTIATFFYLTVYDIEKTAVKDT